MSVQTELDRIIGLVDDSHEAVKAKGGTTATPYLLTNLPNAIKSIPEASDPVLQEKTVTPATSAQSVTPDSGYDGLSKVNVNAMPTATQATPSISVSSAGKITATSTQSAGYVTAGTKTATKNLTTQAAKTVTPTTSNQTAVASGRYTTGAVTVAGDANLVPANIVSGKSIFGVAGTATAGEDLTAEITEYGYLNDELEEVINSLPSAGGGGASLETCTATIGSPMDMELESLFWSDGNTIFNRWDDVLDIYTGGNITVAKNSMIYIKLLYSSSTALIVNGNATILTGFSDAFVIAVTGDCSIEADMTGGIH